MQAKGQASVSKGWGGLPSPAKGGGLQRKRTTAAVRAACKRATVHPPTWARVMARLTTGAVDRPSMQRRRARASTCAGRMEHAAQASRVERAAGAGQRGTGELRGNGMCIWKHSLY